MGIEKRFYWLKLQKDFFKRSDIKIIEGMDNGKDYILFYLKLLCESVENQGNLRFSDTIPYNEKMLSTITCTNIDIVRSAMKVFTSLGMIEILDDETIFMSEVEKMIGSESESAERVRKHRALKQSQMLQCNASVTNCNTEKDIDIEIDKDIEKDIDNKVSKQVSNEEKELFNNQCERTYAREEDKQTFNHDSYDKIFDDLDVSIPVKKNLLNFISHLKMNFGIVMLNDRLTDIIVSLDGKYGRDNVEKCKVIRQAISNGYKRLEIEDFGA